MVAQVEDAREAAAGVGVLPPQAARVLGPPQPGDAALDGGMVDLACRHQPEKRPGGLRGVGGSGLIAAVVELVARAVLAPAAVCVLDRDQPVGGLAHARPRAVEARGAERAQCRPCAVDVVHAPAAEPAAVRHLLALEIVETGAHDGTRRRLAELGQHADAAGADVGGRRIEQRAVIGERNVVEVVVDIVGIERRPAAIAALQALDPFDAARDGLIVGAAACAGLAPRAVHRHDDDGGVVEIGVVRIAVLERPAAGTHVGPPLAPVALRVELLQRFQPAQPRRARQRPRRRPGPPAWPGRQVRYPRPGRRRAGSRPRRRGRPAACRSSGGPWHSRDDPRDSPARRTSSPSSPSRDRLRQDRPRRSAAR